MPIYVGFSQKRRTVRLLSAGGSQYLLCPPADIELAATLNDTFNLRNHTFLWEQIKGPAVILASTDTLGTSFPFSDTDDKTFRFWIDKGTNRAQYMDVDIFYTPTSVRGSICANGHDPFNQTFTIPNLQKADTFIIAEPAGVLNSNVDTEAATLVTFDEVALLELLQKTVKLEILTDSGFVVDPETLYASYNVNDIPYAFELPNGVYRFRFHRDLGQVGLSQETSPLVVCNNQGTPNDRAWAIDEAYDVGAMRINASMTNSLRFTVLRQPVDDTYPATMGTKAGLTNVDGTFYNPDNDPPPITITTPVLVSAPEYPELQDDNSLIVMSNSWLTGHIRLDPSNIGN